QDEGLLITRCDSIHTCFMRFAIDVVYLDRTANVVRLAPGLKPWRFHLGGRAAVHTLELSAGSIHRLGIKVGDSLAALLPCARLGTESP
ncbi:DUF192 domain-containing protein, partial [Ideonella sp.]|uniref:DUF192 domain-containing protein n=1 Tax=Ideonella sp. TaxID=1929293 RepID=UPI0037C19FA9